METCSPSEGQEFPQRRDNETSLNCANERERGGEEKHKILNCYAKFGKRCHETSGNSGVQVKLCNEALRSPNLITSKAKGACCAAGERPPFSLNNSGSNS